MTPDHAMASALDHLPLFASDQEIAEAVVGKERAKEWLSRLLVLEQKAGFPKVDPFHGGRPIPLIRQFYKTYLHLSFDKTGAPSSNEDPFAWNRKSRERAAAKERRRPK